MSCIVFNGCFLPLYQVSPLNGPIEGGTNVTIIGTNLGSVIEEIADVLIGNVSCIRFPELYESSVR